MTKRKRLQQAPRSNRGRFGSLSRRQKGAAILAFMLIIVTFSSYILIKRLNAAAINNARQARTTEALARAKQALIDYAVTFYDLDPVNNAGRFGVLPCPDMSSTPPPGTPPEGAQHGNCEVRHAAAIGRFPWKAFGIEPPRDGYGECLWYVVSGNYKENPAGDMLNEDSNGSLEIYSSNGTYLPGPSSIPPSTRAVAAIIAPGDVINAQDRSPPFPYPTPTGTEICGGRISAPDYLDPEDPAPSGIENYAISTGADDVQMLIHADTEIVPFNDKIVFISRDDIFNAVRKRNDFASKLYASASASNLTRMVALCIAEYGQRGNVAAGEKWLPWAAPVDLGDYRDDSEYNDYNVGTSDEKRYGRIPDIVDNSDLDISGLAAIGSNLLTNWCETRSIGWNPELEVLWRNWKDHLFYVVADPYKPSSAVVTSCSPGDCIHTTGTPGVEHAGLVIFARERQGTQSRDEPPLGTDQKASVANYLDDPTTIANFASPFGQDFDPGANDVFYCIEEDMSVSSC
jgi:hypothetical protein